MDCRKAAWLTLGLTLGAVGCTHQQTVPQTPGQRAASNATASNMSSTAAAQSANAAAPDNQTPIIPKAQTCVAAGAFQERMAADTARTPAERDKLNDLARRSYQQGIRTDSNYLPAYVALANLYEKLGDFERAEATYHSALRIQPKDAAVWFEMGMCQARRHNRWESAVEALKAACELDPENRQYAKTLGFCMTRAGQYDAGLDCLKRVVGEAEAHCDLARMLHHMKQDAASRQQLQLALQFNPHLESARQLEMELDGGSLAPAPPVAPSVAVPTPAPDSMPAPATAPARPVATIGFESLD
ncbi:MAG TPA: tetratricopeptide repeat protein [Gemmataceae bacterium]|nr:tetratricopeptide repeat protein [Gemmataceae bacterium]